MFTVCAVQESVITALQQCYPQIPIYSEPTEQGNPPCFFVYLAEVEQIRESPYRYRRKHVIEVRYMASTYAAMHEMAESLYSELEWIEVSGRHCRAQHMKHSIADDQLRFTIEFENLLVRKKEIGSKMQLLEQEGNVKDD